MTNTAFAIDPVTPLVELLEEHFQDALLDPGAVRVPSRVWEKALLGPLRDFLSRPGKEFRARLVVLAWRLGGGAGAPPRELPLLVELLHAGSLIVDDIEDGSAYRRGRPALHCIYGAPLAINAGNLLYFVPFALLRRLGLGSRIELELHRRIADALVRSHHGQALDVSCRVSELAQHEVTATVEASTRLKTGALAELAASLGAVAAGASRDADGALATFGRELGVSLQMLDDLGGIRSQRRRHKGHEDLVLARLTWPWAWLASSLEPAAYARLRALGRDVEKNGAHPELLAEQMRALLGDRGEPEVHARLERAIDALEAELGPTRALAELREEMARLEASYA